MGAFQVARLLCFSVLGSAVCSCGGGGGGGGTAAPQPIVDQSFEPGSSNALSGFSNSDSWAQTFTVGVTGTLDSVDLFLESQGALDVVRFDVRGTVGGNPDLDDGLVLGSVLVAATDIPLAPGAGFVTLDFSDQAIPVVAGQVLAIVGIKASGGAPTDVLIIAENNGGYADGAAFQRHGGSGVPWSALISDFYIRTRVLPP